MLVPTDFVVAQLALRMTATKATMHALRRRNHIGLPQDRYAGPMHGTFMRRDPFRRRLCGRTAWEATPQTRGLRDDRQYVAPHALARPTSETECRARPAQWPRAGPPGACLRIPRCNTRPPQAQPRTT